MAITHEFYGPTDVIPHSGGIGAAVRAKIASAAAETGTQVIYLDSDLGGTVWISGRDLRILAAAAQAADELPVGVLELTARPPDDG